VCEHIIINSPLITLHPLIEMTCEGSWEGSLRWLISPSPTQLAMSWMGLNVCVLLEMYILAPCMYVLGSGVDADNNGMAHLVTFIHLFTTDHDKYV
jgi:hypothetical protein